MILYHHAIPFERVRFGVIRPEPRFTDPWFKKPCLWLAQQVSFYPLFLAAGSKEWQLRMTGYQDQFRRWQTTDAHGQRIYRKKGEFPSSVLFSFDETDIQQGIFIDEDAWAVIVLNAFSNDRPEAIRENDARIIFKKSLGRAEWLRIVTTGKHRGYTTGVNLVVPELDLTKAKRVWARNQATRDALVSMGFSHVISKRLPVSDFA